MIKELLVKYIDMLNIMKEICLIFKNTEKATHCEEEIKRADQALALLKPCKWHRRENFPYWRTDCGKKDKVKGEAKFCPFCGQPIEEIK